MDAHAHAHAHPQAHAHTRAHAHARTRTRTRSSTRSSTSTSTLFPGPSDDGHKRCSELQAGSRKTSLRNGCGRRESKTTGAKREKRGTP
eukprot:10258311-Alexandrium_andersonii.AAC.1